MENKLREYARLLVQVGLNPYPGQRMVISSPVEGAHFARLCAQEAYDAGCKEVVMNWTDDAMTRMKYLQAAGEVFDAVPLWRRHFFNDHALEGAAYLAISATDPENLKGVSPDRIIRAQRSSGKALKDFDRLQMCGGFPWCIPFPPGPSGSSRTRGRRRPWTPSGTPFSPPSGSLGTARPWSAGGSTWPPWKSAWRS